MPELISESPLASCHLALGARMIPFAGWNLPVEYSGLLAEHKATRQAAGLFDISHMGQIRAQGKNILSCLESLLANDPAKLKDGEGHYSFITNDHGGVIDDLLVYRLSPDDFFLVVNASRHNEILQLLKRHEAPQVRFPETQELQPEWLFKVLKRLPFLLKSFKAPHCPQEITSPSSPFLARMS